MTIPYRQMYPKNTHLVLGRDLADHQGETNRNWVLPSGFQPQGSRTSAYTSFSEKIRHDANILEEKNQKKRQQRETLPQQFGCCHKPLLPECNLNHPHVVPKSIWEGPDLTKSVLKMSPKGSQVALTGSARCGNQKERLVPF